MAGAGCGGRACADGAWIRYPPRTRGQCRRTMGLATPRLRAKPAFLLHRAPLPIRSHRRGGRATRHGHRVDVPDLARGGRAACAALPVVRALERVAADHVAGTATVIASTHRRRRRAWSRPRSCAVCPCVLRRTAGQGRAARSLLRSPHPSGDGSGLTRYARSMLSPKGLLAMGRSRDGVADRYLGSKAGRHTCSCPASTR